MKRLLTAIGLGGVVSLGLFYFMSVLISGAKGFKTNNDSGAMIEFVRLKQDDNLETRRRNLPKKPPEPPKAPKMERLKVAKSQAPQKPQMKMDMPKLDLSSAKGDGPYLGQAGMGGGDSSAVPLVRIEPMYPRKAAMRGIEGWVLVKFDITPAGTVTNVEVLDSMPRRVFDSAARRTILKYKYKPKMIGGKPVAQTGEKLQLDFKLQ